MPTYGKKEYKESNINYLNKDFASLKNSLVNYAKSYFPDTYRDFNETSPGMMLIEMAAYVGDVTSFYIDQQYKEMMLPLAEERRNIINIAKMMGYKTKPVYASHVRIVVTQVVNSIDGDEASVDYSNASVFDKGIKLQSSTNSDIFFETLEPIDFTIEHNSDTSVQNSFNSDGLVSTYLLTRIIKAISSETKTLKFNIGAPSKFLKLNLPQTNVIDVVSCVDTNGNNWYEVDYLAQDRVPVETHYSNDNSRTNAYREIDGEINTLIAIPYALSYISTNKRFTVEVDENNKTSLRFGNGIMKDGSRIDNNFLDLEQVGITIPGQTPNLNDDINNLLGDEYDTLGETPNQTNLTITYRVGGGFNSNISTSDLNSITSGENVIGGNIDGSINTITNIHSATGGKGQETVDEIREKTKSNFTTQNRAVTKHDYKARILNMSSKFGSIAKVVVSRLNGATVDTYVLNVNALLQAIDGGADSSILQGMVSDLDFSAPQGELGTVSVHILSYNKSKHLVGNGQAFSTDGTQQFNDNVPLIMHQNIKTYLDEYRILTDQVSIKDGYKINFGVIFDLIAQNHVNKAQLKIRCIEKIKEYFRIEKMQFNQPIYLSQLEYELMSIDGVRSINQLCITQHEEYNKNGGFVDDSRVLSDNTYYYSFDESADPPISTNNGTINYGWKYDFRQAYNNGVIRPPAPENPGVFELKYPNRNIIGVVR